MKRTYRKILFREVRHTISRFLAIFAIVALGVGFLAGLLATTPDMKLSADRYYDETATMDIRVLSTLGLSEDDIAAIAATKGVAGVMPAYTADVLVDGEDASGTVARIHSLPVDKLDAPVEDGGYQNRVVLLTGRLPEKAGEVVALNTQYAESVQVGDTFTASADNGDLTDTLATATFTVVGTVRSAYYMSIERESCSIGAGHIQVIFFTPEESFSLAAYTDAFILAEGAREQTAFYDAYDETVDAVQDTLEELGQTQATVRYDEIRAEAQEELDKGKAEYADKKAEAEQELADAKKKLDDGRAELEEGEQTLADSRQELADAREQLEEGKQQLADGEAEYAEQKAQAEQQLADAQKKLDDSGAAYEDGLAQLHAGKEELDAAKAAIDEAEVQIAKLEAAGQTELAAQIAAQLAPKKEQYEAGLAEYESQKAVLDAAGAELEAGRQELAANREKAEAELAAAEKTLADTRQTLADSEAAITAGEKELADGEKTLADSRQELEDGQREYDEAKAEADEKLAEAEQEIADAEQQIADIAEPEWYVLDRSTNVSYASFASNVEKVAAISKIFPVFFFLVAALVALTTMTRMVEEQRTQIGTLKALGYTNRAIAFKFLAYAGAASVLGSAFGLLVGLQIFPIVIWNAYEMLYTLPPLVTTFQTAISLGSSAAAVLCTMLATLFACMGTLRERPARLMLPRAPKAGKRIFLERISFIWKRLTFTHKVTARNLIRYKKRFFMTVIGIAGCTALLVAGFGLRDSIGDIIGKQFGELYQYNLTVSLKEEAALTEDETLKAALKADVEDYLMTHQENADLTLDGETISTTLFVPQDAARLPDFNVLRERRSGDPVAFTEDAVLLTEKQAESLGASVGDTFTVERSDGKAGEFRLGGIIENYVQGAVYIAPSLYQKVFGDTPEYTSMVAKVADDSEENRAAVTAALLQSENVQSASFTTDLQESFEDMLTSIDYIVIVLILSAAALAFVVLYNLTNINITERQKEIATIKVLGFYDREVSAYIYRETAVLTLIGAAVGLVLGIFLHAFVVRTAEVDMVMFGRDIKWLSFVLSAALTLFFSLLVNLVMGRKMKKIDMVESMKAGE